MISTRLSIFLILSFSLSLALHPVSGQPVITTGLRLYANPMAPAVTFLTIAPDARSGSLGDAGVATSPDINSQHWNPSKYAFIESKWGTSLSYTPWIRPLFDDMNFIYAAGFYHIDNQQAISTSFRYFSIRDIIFLNPSGNIQGEINPKEMAFDVAYSRVLSENLSVAVALRYIYSNLIGAKYVSGNEIKPGRALAADLALYHFNNIRIFKQNAKFSFGFDISNMGNKVTYTDETGKQFLPANLRLGSAFSINPGTNHTVSIFADINKLMVPTPPELTFDSLGNMVILYGKDPNVSVPVGMIRSFWDSPGVITKNGKRSVFLGELHEIRYSLGTEYWYKNKFSLRCGYFSEHETKGNRKYFAAGVGFRIIDFGIDIGYILPFPEDNPFTNTFHFTLSYQLSEVNSNIQKNKLLF